MRQTDFNPIGLGYGHTRPYDFPDEVDPTILDQF